MSWSGDERMTKHEAADQGDGSARRAKLHGIWLAGLGLLQLCVVLGVFYGSWALLLSAWVLATGGSWFLVGAAFVTLVYAGVGFLPFIGIFGHRRRLVVRLAMVTTPLFFAIATHALAVRFELPGMPRAPEPPFDGCEASTVDPAQRARLCTMTSVDPSNPSQGDCAEGYTCRQPISGGPLRCFAFCHNDCMCPAPATCMNAGCHWPGDSLP